MGLRLSGGGGESRHTLRHNADINVTPFVDVMLVLLIIFMVSIPLATVSINLDIPPPKDSPAPSRPTWISIQQDGQIYVLDRKTTLETLSADLAPVLLANNPGSAKAQDQQVLVRAGADVPYDRFMAVVSRLKRDGYGRIGLISEDIT